MDDRPLSNTVGPVLDPVFSLRTRLRVAPGATVHATFFDYRRNEPRGNCKLGG
ncbi:hypothetical protein ACFS07_16100 [Undibacterium arcticum]